MGGGVDRYIYRFDIFLCIYSICNDYFCIVQNTNFLHLLGDEALLPFHLIIYSSQTIEKWEQPLR